MCFVTTKIILVAPPANDSLSGKRVCVLSYNILQIPGAVCEREVELGFHSWADCLAAELFSAVGSLDTVFVTLFCTSVEVV